MYVVSRHQFYELIQVEIAVGSAQSEDQLGLIFIYVIAVLTYDTLKLFHAYPALLRISSEVFPQVSTIAVVFNECTFQLVQFE